MSYEIIQKYQAESGFWQVQVVISPDESAFFKFPTEPTQEQVDREAEIYTLNKRAAELRIAPIEITTPEPKTGRLTKLEFLNRFTDAELEAIYGAAKVSVQVEVFLAKFNAVTPEADGTSIDLKDDRLIAGIRAFEAGKLIGVGRADEILAV